MNKPQQVKKEKQQTSWLVLGAIFLMCTAISMGFFAVVFQAPLSATFAVTLAVTAATLAILSLRE